MRCKIQASPGQVRPMDQLLPGASAETICVKLYVVSGMQLQGLK